MVIGASVRAFAQSARRAGWLVHAADLFADLDLEAAAQAVVRAAREDGPAYPHNLAAAIRGFPSAPWCYTGAIENHPDVIADIAGLRPLLGSGPEAVRAVRDPVRLSRAVRDAGLLFPDTFPAPDGVPVDASYLVKPVASAGGRGIVRWTGRAAAGAADAPERRAVWQRFVAGEAWGVAYVAGPHAVALLGASRQLTGAGWCHAAEFAYCGSIAAPSLAPRVRDQFVALGEALSGFGLAGVFGVDVIVDAAGRVTVLEVNPRPTASMELLERATGRSIAATHLAACGAASPRPAASAAAGAAIWTKAVLFARRPTAIDAATLATLEAACRPWTEADAGWPALGDIPRAGQTIPAGGPVVTVFARGTDADDPCGPLRARVATIDRLLAAAISRPCVSAAPGRRPPPGSIP